ncbi:NAD(P)-binding protein [Gymnopus androsaceus JB14]|uniref:NAD(P)-binding protein n=1 Tax=Gymnopus androsaceus JB14 TaxID=1447944 RepID=A0A6A4IAT7_9AGAR|nr:NAD(P)-binding protein [Gymnopus androsaceus JB14]
MYLSSRTKVQDSKGHRKTPRSHNVLISHRLSLHRTTMTKILITGVTGYVGGAVLMRLAKRDDFDSFDIRCIVRSPDKAAKIETLYKNVKTIVGSHSDIALMTQAASEVDMVLAMANCDDLDAVTGTLQGMKTRFEETGKQPIFINTSGTGVLCNDAAETIWDDTNPDQIETLEPTQPHRPGDLKIVAADAEGYVKTYIILPALIWSIARGPLSDSGISNKKSVVIPALIRASLDRGNAGMVGHGKYIWNNVEIHDLGDLYNLLFDAVLSPSANPGHGREGYYFGANEEHTMYQVGEAISEVMLNMNKGNGGAPTSFTKEEIEKYPIMAYLSYYIGSNSRCRANRSRALGWTPKNTTKDMLASIYAETELVIEIAASEKL